MRTGLYPAPWSLPFTWSGQQAAKGQCGLSKTSARPAGFHSFRERILSQGSTHQRASTVHTMLATPILRLPVELHLDIINRLNMRDSVNLASTTRYFRSVIPVPTHSELLVAEQSEWARANQLYVCKGCINFHSWENFADDMRKGKWCRSGTHANARLCLKCGVNSALYTPGTYLTIYNRTHVLCRTCRRLTDQVGHHGMCAGCSPGTPRRRCLQYFDHEDDWTCTTNRTHDRNHMQELNNWPDEVQISRY